MSEASDLRQKAETCVRLAETASSQRAHELFQQLAGEYRMKAQALEEPVVSPSLVPPQMEDQIVSPPLAPSTVSEPSNFEPSTSEQWLAEFRALRDRL